MRKVVSENLKIPYNEVILKRTEKGKPYLVRDSYLYILTDSKYCYY